MYIANTIKSVTKDNWQGYFATMLKVHLQMDLLS